jgi:hypothetical protein
MLPLIHSIDSINIKKESLLMMLNRDALWIMPYQTDPAEVQRKYDGACSTILILISG